MIIANKTVKFQILLIGFLLNAGIIKAQLCDRPDSVFIAFTFSKDSSNVVWKVDRIQGQKKYVFDSKHGKVVYFQQSEEKKVSRNFVNQLCFNTPFSLREKELNIINCEIEKSKIEKSVYVDLDINSVFKKIFLVEKRGDTFFMSNVLWYDPVE